MRHHFHAVKVVRSFHNLEAMLLHMQFCNLLCQQTACGRINASSDTPALSMTLSRRLPYLYKLIAPLVAVKVQIHLSCSYCLLSQPGKV